MLPSCTLLVSYLPFVAGAVISPRPGRIGDPVLLKQSRAAVKRTNARLMRVRVRPMGALLFSCENTDRDLISTFLLAVSGEKTLIMHNNQVFWSPRVSSLPLSCLPEVPVDELPMGVQSFFLFSAPAPSC